MVDKKVLIQYKDIQEEIKEVRERIRKTEKAVEMIERDGIVVDSVSGGYGGTQHFKIEGFPYSEYSRKKTLLYNRKAILSNLEMELMESANKVEEFISGVKDSRMRRIINFRYLDNMSWQRVANCIGENATADGVRMEFERFMKKK